MLESIFPFGQEIEALSASAVESRIDGPFKGFSARARFRLFNGQVWEQRSFNCAYRYSYMPRVVVFRVEEGFRMKVEGVPETVPVRRIR